MNAATYIECNVLHCSALQVPENGEGSVKNRCSALLIVTEYTLLINVGRCVSGEAVLRLWEESVKSCSD